MFIFGGDQGKSHHNSFRKEIMSGHIADAGNINWNTPSSILDAVRKVFGGTIDLDPCSNSTSLVGATHAFSLPDTDGLGVPWRLVDPSATRSFNIFVNPPYGIHYISTQSPYICISAKEYRETCKSLSDLEKPAYQSKWQKQTLANWINKINSEWLAGSNIIAFIPASVDTFNWQEIIFKNAGAVCFVKGRMKFLTNGEESDNSAPMPVALVLWSKDPAMILEFVKAMEHTEKIGKCFVV